MICRDDLPPTPDWCPDASRELTWDDELALAKQADHERGYDLPRHVRSERMKPHAECPAHVSEPLTWASDGGDDG